MSNSSVIQPALLSRINERQVLRVLQSYGPLSRAEVARHSGISAPTASKAVESLLRSGFLEEGDAPELLRGRPGKRLRLASQTAQVLGFVIDVDVCRLVCAGLDGKLHTDHTVEFPTPVTYTELIQTASERARDLMNRSGISTCGMAISMPGQIDYRQNRAIFSPNVPITNNQSPSFDLSERLGIECIMVQESHALCLAERHYGLARKLDDFAMLDVGAGIGLGVMSGSRLLTGHSGLAGEIGHTTVELNGRLCGCGNRGCLETVASDAALAWRVSERIGRKLTIAEVVSSVQSGEIEAQQDLELTISYLAIGLAAVINMFNPATLFVHGALFSLDSTLFTQLIMETQRRTLPPSYADCQIVQARGSKRQGAIAAIIEHLTNSMVPTSASDYPIHRLSSGALSASY